MKYLVILMFCFLSFGAKADQILQFGNSMSLSDGRILCLDAADLQKRQIFEKNDMAGIMCKMMTLLTSDITKAVLAFVLVVMGFGAYLGKINLGLIVSFVIGTGLLFMIPLILGLLAPYSDVGAGCNCKRYFVAAYDVQLGYIYGDLLLNSDCSTCPNYKSCK
jgi:type IV secretory pathway VirB2 component (pilin)